jgi:predicted deacylase
MKVSLSKTAIATILTIVAVAICISLGVFIYKKTSFKEEIKNIPKQEELSYQIIGNSIEKRKIEAYSYGIGTKEILFVGGIHGGYEWNSVILAYKFIEYLNSNKNIISENIKITIIPSANPDGLYKVIPKTGVLTISDIPTSTKQEQENARFNVNNVDLNRNFGCKWKPESTWRGKKVSAGTSAFSEPEAQAIKNYVEKNKPVAVIFWHSQSNAVYASECTNGILPETINIMNAYSFASGYSPIKTFDSYEITGDAEGWLASVNIPAITVELKTHETIEWQQNLAGFNAILNYYNK